MSTLTADTIGAFLDEQSRKSTLRFITCGSVDDGKSTLIGRLLFESKNIFDDQLSALESDSRRYGTQGGKVDLALLVDGLQAEREQGITIDVAYRFFATDKRRYIVADTPGHEQYTRNMATGASTADLAVILVDARKGVLTQTRRHSRIAAMMGIRHFVLAVNKMDLVGCDEPVFSAIVDEYKAFVATLGDIAVAAIPVSGLDGDNVLRPSERMPWYHGPTLMAHLDTVELGAPDRVSAFRMPIQYVNRPDLDFRGFSGRLAAGHVRVGDRVRVLPSGVVTSVRAVISGFDQAKEAVRGDSVTLTLAEEVDASRGDVIVAADAPPEVADQFEARLLWLNEHDLVPGRQYLLKSACKEVTATITAIKHREDVNTGAHMAAKALHLNEIAVVNLATSAPLVFEPYTRDRALGSFILVDKLTFATVGAGMIDFALRRASNIHWQSLSIGKDERAAQKHQRPRCIWFTGLSGSGKSTVADLVERALHAEGRHTYLLDGDNVRHGLNRDLGFTEADRVENIRRVAEVARLMVDAGLIVLVSFISPFRSERRAARDLFAPGEFVEVFVDTPLEECERRDVKGLYAKARKGELRNFTGVDSAYERPEAPEVHLHTLQHAPEELALQVIKSLG
ncbi:MAG: sulfate adenylyltransferase subunit CysN [Flavobacteriales bacterium]|nr:sulfate adenylyltransferase subunit CysN [Flavobacteriales bacterium]